MSDTSLSLSDFEDFDEFSASLPSSPQHIASPRNPDTMSRMPSSPSSAGSSMSGKQKSTDEPGEALAYKNHSRFYFGDGNIVFLVEDMLYRVHRYFFWRDSQFFVDLLLNRFTNANADDSTSKTPITLDDVKCPEFEAFLSILYPTSFHECDVRTVEGWTSVLRLSTKWSFSSIRTLAIERLEPIASPVDKVALGRTYGIDAWLATGFAALCERPQSLTREEGRKLGVDDVIIVAAVREVVKLGAKRRSHDAVLRIVEACLASPEDDGAIPEELALLARDVDADTPGDIWTGGDAESVKNGTTINTGSIAKPHVKKGIKKSMKAAAKMTDAAAATKMTDDDAAAAIETTEATMVTKEKADVEAATAVKRTGDDTQKRAEAEDAAEAKVFKQPITSGDLPKAPAQANFRGRGSVPAPQASEPSAAPADPWKRQVAWGTAISSLKGVDTPFSSWGGYESSPSRQ